jgi:hypothetical protein
MVVSYSRNSYRVQMTALTSWIRFFFQFFLYIQQRWDPLRKSIIYSYMISVNERHLLMLTVIIAELNSQFFHLIIDRILF